MKFRALLLALLLIPAAADARLMVVMDNTYHSTAATALEMKEQGRYASDRVLGLLDRVVGPKNYFVVPPWAAKTEFCRTGIMVWNFGGAGTRTDTAQAVLHVNFNGRATSLYTGYRPDSLTLTENGPNLVPQLMWPLQSSYVGSGFLQDSVTRCSTGAAGPSNLQDYGSGCQSVNYVVSATTGLRFMPMSFVARTRDLNRNIAGGLRVHLNDSREFTSLANSFNSKLQSCAWCDSNTTAATDSAFMWERPMSHVSTGKPIIFANVYGISACSDSGVGAVKPPCEWDPLLALISLARLDSLTGGRVFDANLLPLKMALVIDGGFKRSYFMNPGGIAPNDTAAFKASLDSLASLRIPYTVLAQADSIATYPSEKSWWKGFVRFAPRVDVGGQSSASGAYTAIAAQKTLLRVNFPDPANISTALGCVNDDWSPSGTTEDSLLARVADAGVSVIITDSQTPYVASIGYGYPKPAEVVRREPYGGRLITLLAHTGYRINGSQKIFDVRTDSVGATICQTTAVNQYTFPNLIAYEGSRAWAGLIYRQYRDFDFMPYRWIDAWDDVITPKKDVLYPLQRASIVRASCNDFGSGYLTPASRPGWWHVKNVTNGMKVINAMAARAVVVWSYPDEIKP